MTCLLIGLIIAHLKNAADRNSRNDPVAPVCRTSLLRKCGYKLDDKINRYLDIHDKTRCNYQVLEKLKRDDGRKYDYWAARQQHIDMGLLLNVTDISEEDLNKYLNIFFAFSIHYVSFFDFLLYFKI